MREDINAEYKPHISIVDTVKLALHYVSKVILWSIFLILIIAAVTLVVYFIDLKKNIETGKNTIPLFNAYVIISPSMVPAIKVQDAVVVMRTDVNKLKKNDIITFDSKDPRYDGITITHRIVGIENKGSDNVLFRTKGDNNNTEDTALVNGKNIYGKVILRIPKIGYIQYFLSQTYGWVLAVVVPCLGIIIYDIMKLIKTIKEETSRKNKKDKNNQFVPKTVSSLDLKKKNGEDEILEDEILDSKEEKKKDNIDKERNKKQEKDENKQKYKNKSKAKNKQNKKKNLDEEDEYLEVLRKYSEQKKHKKGGR